jgi:hypothetical protein
MDATYRLARDVAGMLRTHYPNVALGLPLKPDEIPIFIYRDVVPESFAFDLDFLRRNGYETLGLEVRASTCNALQRLASLEPVHWMAAADPSRRPERRKLLRLVTSLS